MRNMTTPARPTGLFGRRPPKRAPAIPFTTIRRTGAPPPSPTAVDYFTQMRGGWKMLGNGPDDSVFPGFQGCGDCVAVDWANRRRMISKVIGGREVYPTWPQVLAIYRTQNPRFNPAGGATTGPGSPADGGMDIQTLLEWLVKHPGPDGSQMVGFAAVDTSSPADVRAAITAGGVLSAGFLVQDAQMGQFSAGQPWDYTPGSPVDGGHCVAVAGYGAEPAGSPAALGGDEKFVTWGEETSFTDRFWAQEVEELWFPVWREQLGTAEFQAGVDVAAFAAEYTAITGRPFPAPIPPPAPVPVGGPYPQVMDGRTSLGKLARQRNTTIAHLLTVTGAAMTPADEATAKNCTPPKGMIIYTTNP